MGSPKKAAQQAVQNTVDSYNDVGTGIHQILHGDVASGASNIGAGTLGVTTAGLSQQVVPGQTRTDRAASDQQNADVEDAQHAVDVQVQNRQTAITERINAMATNRRRTPGRAITLLTSQLSPNSQNTNQTLLTTKAGG